MDAQLDHKSQSITVQMNKCAASVAAAKLNVTHTFPVRKKIARFE